MLKIITQNLISNTIKFTNTRKEINIVSTLKRDGIEVIISATNIGVKAEKY